MNTQALVRIVALVTALVAIGSLALTDWAESAEDGLTAHFHASRVERGSENGYS